MGWKTKEQSIAYRKEYYKKNKEKILKKSLAWARANPEKRRIISRRSSRKINGTTEEGFLKSDTYKGFLMEKRALKYFPGGRHMNAEIMNAPYDIEWGGLKIDVKSRELYKRKNKRGKPVKREQKGYWTFSKGKNDSDYYFCLCLVEHKLIKIYFIPKEHFGNGICVGMKSKKYDRFLFNNKTLCSI